MDKTALKRKLLGQLLPRLGRIGSNEAFSIPIFSYAISLPIWAMFNKITFRALLCLLKALKVINCDVFELFDVKFISYRSYRVGQLRVRIGWSVVNGDNDHQFESRNGDDVESLVKAFKNSFPCLLEDFWRKCIVPAIPHIRKVVQTENILRTATIVFPLPEDKNIPRRGRQTRLVGLY